MPRLYLHCAGDGYIHELIHGFDKRNMSETSFTPSISDLGLFCLSCPSSWLAKPYSVRPRYRNRVLRVAHGGSFVQGVFESTILLRRLTNLVVNRENGTSLLLSARYWVQCTAAFHSMSQSLLKCSNLVPMEAQCTAPHQSRCSHHFKQGNSSDCTGGSAH